jgi:hypothetical protein
MARPTFSSPVRRAMKSPTASTPSKTPLSRDKIIDGRIKKACNLTYVTNVTKLPKLYSSSPSSRRLSDSHHDSSSLLLDDVERDREVMRYEEMMDEKKLFPGSEHWADDEDRLFQLLFMRQYSPLLPSHWGMDFRGIPVPDILFATSDEDEPAVYAHAPNGDFKGKWTVLILVGSPFSNLIAATKAIIRLIDLTASVRAFVQMNKGPQAASHIKKELETYLKWAAWDGGYDKLNALSNIIVEAVDVKLGTDKILPFMDERMRDLARQHRRFWRVDHADDEDSVVDLDEDLALPTPGIGRETGNGEYDKSEDKKQIDGSLSEGGPPRRDHSQNDHCRSPQLEHNQLKKTQSGEEPPQKNPQETDMLSESDHTDGYSAAQEEANLIKMDLDQYIEPPPVLYGIFIVNRTVVVLTVDPAKGQRAYVSLQVEINFQKRNQGVWNAITIAIVVCMARDEMIRRKEYFEPMMEESDDDPDA